MKAAAATMNATKVLLPGFFGGAEGGRTDGVGGLATAGGGVTGRGGAGAAAVAAGGDGLGADGWG